MASHSCAPYIVGVTAVLAAPWRPHCGVQVRLRSSGCQLLCRELVVAARLPQAPRPQTQPVPGPKSSRAKAERAVARSTARITQQEAVEDMFGDLATST
eukprot:4553346-Pyramimonas_sp.AAC.1